MLNFYDIDRLMKETVEERVRIQTLNRQLRATTARQAAQRRLQREIQRFVHADGDVDILLNALEQVVPHRVLTVKPGAGTSCCS